MAAVRRVLLAIPAVVLIAAAAAPAKAEMWNFSYDTTTFSGPDTIASGMLTTLDVPNGDGSFTITGITGTRTINGVTDVITGLAPIDSYGGNDNELFALPSPQLTGDGLTFFISNPVDANFDDQVNIFYGYGYAEYSDDDAANGWFTATPVSTPVPEPSTFVLSSILIGIFGVAWANKRLVPPHAVC